ncbi:hypothetical protein NON00_12375 [Roseomonas sp. GC11]|uniref:hypothetical protein n=1 Tax=Roseomonas sp. GC11 TaxID=2950546 RepID=UPI00210E738C|nr:hypothetical protein [Roseomonas sp. GC11]MCQ4160722.1 hypothetical protein [Roseomonas sp. GC11]
MRCLVLLLLLALAPLPALAETRALAVAEDGRVATGGENPELRLWPADLIAPLAALHWHQGPVQALAALPGGGFASAGEDGRVALWPTAWGNGITAPERVLEAHAGPVTALAAREGWLLSAGWDGTAWLWPLAGGPLAGGPLAGGPLAGGPPRALRGAPGPITAAAFRSDGLPVTAGADGTLRLWGEDGQPRILASFAVPQSALATLPGGLMASVGGDGMLHLTGPAGTQRHLDAGRRPLAALAASADGSLLAAAGPGGGLFVWSLPEGRLRHSLPTGGTALWALGFSPDGALLYATGADGRLRGFDMARGTTIGPPLGAAPPPPATPRQAGLDMEGARVFRACGACHGLSAPPPGQADLKAGPHLGGLFGRRMGSVPGYAYSERLSRGDIVWTKETLADLLTRGPEAMLPGSRQPELRIGDGDDLAALLRFLEQATKD